MAELEVFDYDTVNSHVKNLMISLLGPQVFEKLSEYFMNSTRDNFSNAVENNIFQDEESGIEVLFDTVYGVKGETHDATLYLGNRNYQKHRYKTNYTAVGRQRNKEKRTSTKRAESVCMLDSVAHDTCFV